MALRRAGEAGVGGELAGGDTLKEGWIVKPVAQHAAAVEPVLDCVVAYLQRGAPARWASPALAAATRTTRRCGWSAGARRGGRHRRAACQLRAACSSTWQKTPVLQALGRANSQASRQAPYSRDSRSTRRGPAIAHSCSSSRCQPSLGNPAFRQPRRSDVSRCGSLVAPLSCPSGRGLSGAGRGVGLAGARRAWPVRHIAAGRY